MEQQHRNQRIYLWLALGCILVGTSLRLLHLGDESIALDEDWVFQDLQQGMTPSVLFYEHRTNTVLYLIHWAVFRFLGPDEFLMRLPEAFEGVLSIAAVYGLGRTLFNRQVGLLGAFLLAISPFHLQMSTWARYYALATLLAVLALLCAYRAQKTNDWRMWSCFALLNALNVFNHLTGLFALISVNAWLGILITQQALSSSRGQRVHLRAKALVVKLLPLLLGNLLILGLLLLISSTPLRLANSFSAALFGVRLFNVPSSHWVSGIGGENSAGGFELSSQFLANLVGDFVGGAEIAVFVYGLVFLLGLSFMLSRACWKHLLLTGLWLGLPFALLRVIEIGTFFKTRYFSFMLPLFLIVAAVGIDGLGMLAARWLGFLKRRWLNWAGLSLSVLLFGTLGLSPLRQVTALQFPDWRGLSQFFKEQALPGDTIVVLPYTVARASFSYYYKPFHENTSVIFVEWDFAQQLEARPPVKPVWWVVPAADLNLDEWRQTGFSVYSLDGATVLHKPDELSSDTQVLDEAVLILEEFSAKHRFEEWLDLDTTYYRNQALLHSALASVYCALNQHTQCDVHFQSAIDLFSAFQLSRGVSNLLAVSVLDLRDLARLAREIGKSGYIEALVRQWIREQPDRPGPYRLLAEWYVVEGRLEEAVGEFKKAIDLGGGTRTDHMDLAVLYEDLGDVDHALIEYRQQVELQKAGPLRATGGAALARAYQRQGSTRMAIKAYEETLEQAPFEVALYKDLGYLYLGTENWPRAEELFQRATRINPNLGWPHLALGDLYWRQGLKDKAAVEYRRAIEKEPFARKAYRRLANLFEAQGDLEGVIRIHDLAARNNSRFAWPDLDLGSLYVRQNRVTEATAAYQKAVEIEPWNETAQANLQGVHWSLAASLNTVEASTEHTPLIWWLDDVWVRPYPYEQDVLVGRSALSVDGLVRSDQIHLHPFSADQATYLHFVAKDCQYDAIQVGYGLADQVAGLSNGVRYTFQASVDGGHSYTVLLDQPVIDSVWLSQTLPLTAYRGDDVIFRLTVDALGDDAYDWLQATVRLFPALGLWDLSANLDVVQVTTSDASSSSWILSTPSEGEKERSGARAGLDERTSIDVSQVTTADTSLPLRPLAPSKKVRGDSVMWVGGDGRPLVTVSQASVQGAVCGNQVQFHPSNSDQDTNITFTIADNPYSILKTAYALADEAVAQSDGVDYEIAISTDGGRTYSSLLQVEVSQNNWNTETLDLSAYLNQDLTIRLLSSSRGNENYDWLQVTLYMLPSRQAVQN